MAILAYDDVMLREPALLTPYKKPTGPVRPNPAFGQCVALFMPGSRYGLKNIATGSDNGTKQGTARLEIDGVFGEALITDGTNGGLIDHSLSTALPMNGPLLLVCVFRPTIFGSGLVYGDNQLLSLRNGAAGLRYVLLAAGASGVGRLYAAVDGDTDASVNTSIRDDTAENWRLCVSVCTMSGDGLISVFNAPFKQHISTATAAASGAYTLDTLDIGGSGRGTTNVAGNGKNIFMAAVFASAPSSAGLFDIAVNPYSVVIPA